jgi:sulfonate transport system substrate-binding protein
MKFRLGSHPNNLSLFILRHRGVIEPAARERGWQLEWFDYTQGARSGEWLADEQVDVVGTGSTPPIAAQVAGQDVAYLASSPPRDNNCALLTVQSNDISSLRDKRLAGMPGSFTDHFLARLLQKHNLRRADITLLDLQGQDALDALLNGDIDGWLAIDPWLTRALQVAGVVARSAVGDEIINRSLFWTRAAWQQRYPEAAAWVVEQLRANDAWIEQHPIAAAQILADKLNSSILPDEWLKTLRGRLWGITPANDALLAEQQQQADDLFAVGFIPTALSLNARRDA